MNNFVESNDDRFANGQVNRDLRGNSDGAQAETKLEVTDAHQFPAPIGRLLGLRLIRVENGTAVVEFAADERHANPMGTLHGGVLCDLADAAMGIAYRSTLPEGESLATIELKINFLRPVWKATLRATARVVHAGKIVGLIDCDVVDEQNRLVARASSTCMTLRGRLAEGRRPPAL